jgi:hypothetical protein
VLTVENLNDMKMTLENLYDNVKRMETPVVTKSSILDMISIMHNRLLVDATRLRPVVGSNETQQIWPQGAIEGPRRALLAHSTG